MLAAGGLICGALSAWLAIMNDRARLPGYLVALGEALAFLSLVPVLLLYRGLKRKRKKYGLVILVMIWAGLIFALLGFSGLYAISCPNCGA